MPAIIASLVVVSCSQKAPPGGKALRLATTTSVQDSGLLEIITRRFEKETGYVVSVQAVGSGRALDLLLGGKVDVAITHAAADEEALVRRRAATRLPFMHNEFVIAGPPDKASFVAGAGDFRPVMKAIAASGSKFVSRGDDSGTHRRERLMWREAGLPEEAPFIVPAKAGMAEALERASKEKAFVLADRSTFVTRRKQIDLVVLFAGDDELRNTYSILLPTAAEGTNSKAAAALAAFLRSAAGRTAIGGFGVREWGEPLFTPEE